MRTLLPICAKRGFRQAPVIHNTSILDDILNATVPIEKDMGENMIDMSKRREDE